MCGLASLFLLLLSYFWPQLLQAANDPRVLKCVQWCHSPIWLPLDALVYEVDKVFHLPICMHQSCKLLTVYVTNLALRIRCLKRPIIIIEENLASRCLHNHRTRWETFNLHDALHLLLLIFSSEERKPNEQLIKYAAEGPHVNRRSVADTQHYLGCPVETRLDVGVKLFIFVSARAEVNNFYARFV